MADDQEHRIYIRDAAKMLGRQMSTLRKWESLGVIPAPLQPQRGTRGWRYWTPDQIEGLRRWLRETDRRPGKGLPHWNPTEKELEEAIKKMRLPRKSKLEKNYE